MAAAKVLAVAIVLVLVLLGARAGAGVEGDVSGSALEQLRSKIFSLELSISEKAQELKSKDDSIAWLGKLIQEKSASIASLEKEIESLQKKGALDVAEMVGKSNARASELEAQVRRLIKEIQIHSREKDALEARAREAEKKAGVLNLKLERLQKTVDEQKHRIQKAEQALKVAEEELMRAQLEATSKSKELTEVHKAWLPPWFVTHIDRFQVLTVTCWNEHVKPALAIFLQKASEKSAEAQKWAEPHLQTAKTQWIPAVKECCESVTNCAKPYMESMSAKAIDIFEKTKATVTPHIVKARKSADPYLQEAKKITKHYIDQVTSIIKPHVEKVQQMLKPYTKHATHTYRKFLKSSTGYHCQVQATVQEKLKMHELTSPLATKEFAWLLASALFVVPIFFLYRLLSCVFCKKARKRPRNAHGSHSHRRHKRRHTEK